MDQRITARSVVSLCLALAAVGVLPSSAGPGSAAAKELRVEVEGQSEEQAADEARLLEALKEPVELSYFADTLADVIDDLHNRYLFEIEVDEETLERNGLDTEIWITRELLNVSAGSALELILSEYDLTYVLDDGKLLITTPHEAETYLTTRTYHCGPLLAGDSAEAWIGVITRSIDGMSWADVGGLGEIELADDGDSLIVTQTLPAHRAIEDLLHQALELQASIEAGSAPAELQTLTIGLTPPQQAAHAKIEAALARETKVSFFEDTLLDVVLFLEDYHEIQIEIDATALDDAGLGSDVTITCELRNLTLASALNLILSEYDLSYTIDDEVLLITTPMEAENNMPTRLYTSKVLRNLDPQEAEAFPPLIINLIEPTTWDVIGGLGHISYLTEPGVLVVTQTYVTQVQMESLLEQLSTPLPAGAGDELHIGRVATSPAAAQRETAVLEQLRQPIAFSFENESLAEILELLAIQQQLQIAIDETALDDAGLRTDLPITAEGDFDSFASGLAEILEPYELTWRVSNEVLQITTLGEVEWRTQVCIYRGRVVGEILADDPDAVIKTIVAKIAPESWDEVGGFGSIAYFESSGALVVVQSDQARQQIENYLRELAEAE